MNRDELKGLDQVSTVDIAEVQRREQRAYETGQRDGARAERHGRAAEITEAERRGAVMALRRASVDAADIWNVKPYPYMWLATRADAIESGAAQV